MTSSSARGVRGELRDVGEVAQGLTTIGQLGTGGHGRWPATHGSLVPQTGPCAWWAIWVLADPISSRANPPAPREPTKGEGL